MQFRKHFLIQRFTILSILALLNIFLLASCDNLSQKVDSSQFIGVWKLEGRSMLEGVQIEITKDKQGELIGKVNALNDNRYVQLFMEVGDPWITSIKRASNTDFQMKEKKIGSALFSLYDLATTTEFTVEFIDKNTIGLGGKGMKSEHAKIRYVRVQKK